MQENSGQKPPRLQRSSGRESVPVIPAKRARPPAANREDILQVDQPCEWPRKQVVRIGSMWANQSVRRTARDTTPARTHSCWLGAQPLLGRAALECGFTEHRQRRVILAFQHGSKHRMRVVHRLDCTSRQPFAGTCPATVMNRDRRIDSLGPFPLGELNMLLPIVWHRKVHEGIHLEAHDLAWASPSSAAADSRILEGRHAQPWCGPWPLISVWSIMSPTWPA